MKRALFLTLAALLAALALPVLAPAETSLTPGINPLGDMAAYTSTRRVRNATTEMEIPVGDGVQVVQVSGDTWYLSQDRDDGPEAIRKQLLDYAKASGAKVLRPGPRYVILTRDDGDAVWWCLADVEARLDLTVVRALRLDEGKPLTFAMGRDGLAEVRFHAVNPGGRFRSLTVSAPSGEYTVEASQIMQSGAYKRTVNGKWYVNAGRAPRQVIDTLPQEAGTCAFILSTNADAPLTDVTVELVEHPYPVPKVEMGEKLGALRIKNVPYGLAKIVPSTAFGVIYSEHPELAGGQSFENGDATPEGDAYFLMPAGLWQVAVQPEKATAASSVGAHFIPVHSGKETVLDWPLAMTSVFGADADSGLAVNSVRRSGADVDVTFSLQGPEAATAAPTTETLAIRESGVPAKVLSVKRTRIPLDIVLLVDSSGSMKGQIEKALAATRTFIEALPDDAKVRVVDFDTTPRPLNGTTKAEALRDIAGIKANGATCLNDAVLLGLQMLGGSERPALLLFTDGFDANHNDTGPGSQATKEETLQAVGAAGIPIYTIGFGKGHDLDTLDRLASLSGGRYYAASDPAALGDAFAVINSSLSNTFTARYARPARGRPSDAPVVTCVVDVSGSMDTTPDKDGCDYRIDKVKTVLHDFFTALPANVLAQVMSFEDDIYINQVTTDNVAATLAGINDLTAGGGTNIAGAVESALKAQAAIPSSKRYMVFLTDAALQVDGEDRLRFDTTLAKLKDEGVYCLWVGIGSLDETPFRHAAEVSGGGCILTESPDALGQAFAKLAADIREPVARGKEVNTLIELTLKYREPSGRNVSFANAAQAVLPEVAADDTVELPASIGYTVRPLKERYDPDVAALVTGDSVPVRDAKIGKRIPIGVSGGNKAAAISVREAYFMSLLRGVQAPSGNRFLVLTAEMRNTLPKQTVTVYPDGTSHPASWVGNDKATRGKQVEMVPTYLVPDLKRHLFLRWNNEMMTPVSPATWLTEAPFILPGENAVSVPPGKPVTGAIVFLVPDGTMRQMSLHFYDTNYGHAEIPLVGALPAGVERLSGLPAKPPVRLSDTFSLAIREVADVTAVGGQEAGGGCVYRIVDADLVSNVQALLDLNPAERFSLRLNTTEGALSVRLHNVTGMLPLGFLAPTMLSPGSSNRVRLAFRVPERMAAEAGKGELVVDVKGGGVVIPLDEMAAKAPVAPVPPDAIRGDGVRLAVNALKRLDGEGDVFVADLTLFDDKDGKSTSMTNAFILKKKNFVADPGYQAPPPDYGKSKGLAGFATGNAIIPVGTMPPDSITDDLIFGITDDTVIPDGGSLRGLVVFKLPYGDAEPGDWLLTSSLFPDLKRELGAGRYDEERLMARRSDVAYQVNATYLDGLTEAVARLTRQREARGFKRPGDTTVNRQTLDGEQPPSRSVPVPDLTAPASDQFEAIKDLKGLKARLAKVRYLPSDGAGWQHLFAPQAVLTQNWGSEGDIAFMAERVLARQGVTTRRVTVDVTDKGKAALAALAGVDEASVGTLPALLYHDAKGNRHVLVAPFMETAAKLSGLVGPIRDRDVSAAELQATVTAYLLAKPKNGGQGKAARDLSDAFSGETDTGGAEPVCLLTANPTLPELSRGAVDLGYTVVGYGNGAVVKAVFDGNDKRVIGSDAIDTGDYEVVGERIVIDMPGGQLTFERQLEEGESIVDRFHTLGLNLPDMDAAAVRSLTGAMQAAHKGETSPDNLSALKWYARNLLYRFVGGQTEYETGLAAKMNLVVGRSSRPRCVIATVSRAGRDGAVRTSIDLRRTANQIHPSAGFTEQAAHGFNIMSGIFASRLESDVLPGGGTGFFEMLAHYPADTEFMWLTADARYNMADQLKTAVPERVLKLLDNGGTVLFPSQPAIIDGRPRWSWLEVNPETYETIAVLDTGGRGSMVERVFSDLWRDGLDYITGGLVGVSSSIWSVSAFSLVLDDYKQILAEAKKFALGLADNFSASVKVGDFEFKGKVGGSTIEAGYTGSGAGAVNAAKSAKGAWDKLNNPKIDLGGFEGGFKDGVNAYFAAAGG